MVTRAAVLAKASEWVGMTERTGNNDIWFAEDWGILGQSWCFAFVQSCFYYADPSPTGALPHQSMYCPYGIQWARDNGQAIEVGGAPTPGDVVFFSWDMATWPRNRAGTGDHVGIVEAWDGGDQVHTIEGNIGSPQGVYRKTRSISGTVVCFWRPTVYGAGPLTIAEEDDMFDDPARADLTTAKDAAVELRDLVKAVKAIVEVHDPLIRRIYNSALHMLDAETGKGLLMDVRNVLGDTFNLVAQGDTTPAPTQPGPLPPVGKPADVPADTGLQDRVAGLESRLGGIEQALAKLLDQAKPAA